MKTIRESMDRSGIPSSREQYLLFDIETTGFHRQYTILYMISCGYYRKGRFHFIQWFNDDGESETEILQEFSDLLESAEWVLLTFNGESFDIPYLKARYELAGLPCHLDSFESVDYYRLLRPFQMLFGMDHGSQKYWEHFLGIDREDRYNGGQLIDVYKRYLSEGAPEDEQALILHNREDVLGMELLFPLFSYLKLLDGSFLVTGAEAAGDDSIRVFAVLTQPIPRNFEVAAQAGRVKVAGSALTVTIPCEETRLRHFFQDYKNYYFLPKEDRAVHRSVGRFVDHHFRKAAKASTCYVWKEGLFLPFPLSMKKYGFVIEAREKYGLEMNCFRKKYKDEREYVELNELFSEEANYLTEYLSDTIKEIFISFIQESADQVDTP